MMQIGLKLWATNLHYLKETARLWHEGFFDYLELTAVIGSYKDCAAHWKSLGIPCVIHGPTFSQGFCFSNKELFASNMRLMSEIQQYADLFNTDVIIMHPGVNGDIHETARQLRHIHDPRITIENKPAYIREGLPCNGSTPEDIAFLQKETGVAFCFDAGHALCAANSFQQDLFPWIQQFIDLHPAIFHLYNGDASSPFDDHWHFSKGNYPIKEIIAKYPPSCRVTLETEHSYPDSLKDFEADALFIRQLALTCGF